MARRPTVQIIARDTGDRLQAPRTNSALQLAESLGDLAPEVRTLAVQVGKERKEKAEAEATAAALQNAGAAFSDAVKDGRLKPTQNPWFIQAYRRESAQIRATGQLHQLALDSQTWASRNDPAAFNTEWNQRVGELAGAYADTDSAQGFQGVAANLSSQVLNQQMAQQAERIVSERKQNLSALAAEAIAKSVRENGGNPDPQKVWDALAPLKDQWGGTGGTDPEWNLLVMQGITSAAYSTQTPELFDVLKTTPGDPTPDPLEDAGEVDDGQATAVSDAMAPEGARVSNRAAEGGLSPSRVSSDPKANERLVRTSLGGVFGKGLVVHSTLRTRAQQDALIRQWERGGRKGVKPAQNSDHLWGGGFDISVKGKSMAEVAAQVRRSGLPIRAVINEGDHVHVSLLRPGRTGKRAPVSSTSIYNIAGVADAVENDRYRITAAIEHRRDEELNARRDAIKLEGQQASDKAFDRYGVSLLSGTVATTDLIAFLQGEGVTPQGIGAAIGTIQEQVANNLSLQRARTQAAGLDPANGKRVLDLFLEGRQKGYSKDHEERVAEAMLTGLIDRDDAIRFVDVAMDRTRQVQSDAKADAREAAADARERRANQPGIHIKSTSAALAEAGLMGDVVSSTLQTRLGQRVSTSQRKDFQQRARDAAASHLAANPSDYAGAVQAARMAAARGIAAATAAVRSQRQGGQAGPAPVASSTVNPRR